MPNVRIFFFFIGVLSRDGKVQMWLLSLLLLCTQVLQARWKKLDGSHRRWNYKYCERSWPLMRVLSFAKNTVSLNSLNNSSKTMLTLLSSLLTDSFLLSSFLSLMHWFKVKSCSFSRFSTSLFRPCIFQHLNATTTGMSHTTVRQINLNLELNWEEWKGRLPVVFLRVELSVWVSTCCFLEQPQRFRWLS